MEASLMTPRMPILVDPPSTDEPQTDLVSLNVAHHLPDAFELNDFLSIENRSPKVLKTKGIRPEELTGWSLVAYKTAVLAPKLIFTSAGAIAGGAAGTIFGAGIGASLGAGVGNAVGTFIGCMLSLAIEIVIRKYILNDPSLEEESALSNLVSDRIKTAAFLSIANFVTGVCFANILNLLSSVITDNTLRAVLTGAIVSGCFLLTLTAARLVYTLFSTVYKSYKPEFSIDERLILNSNNFKSDLKVALFVTFFAQTAVGLVCLHLTDADWLLLPLMEEMRNLTAFFLGGISGNIVQTHIEQMKAS